MPGKTSMLLHRLLRKKYILDEIIWNNRFIKIQGFSVYYKAWHEAGFEKIKDIVNGNPVLSYKDFCKKYNLKYNYLMYFGVCHVIPPNLIKMIKGKLQALLNKPLSTEKYLKKNFHVSLLPIFL